LNFSNASEAMINEGIARLGRVINAQRGRVPVSTHEPVTATIP
jgi:hypothetical protein